MGTPPTRGHTQRPLPPEIKVQHHVCNAFAQRSPLRLSLGLFFVFLLEAGHIGTLCLSCSRSPDFQKESRCQNKRRCLYTVQAQ